MATKIQKVQNQPNFPEMEEKVNSFWKENRIFEKSVEQRDIDNSYSFVDGPPFVSGMPHYGHLLTSIAKDVVPRYWTMKGKRVRRVWGWDCHGLPIEEKVNKKFGIKSSAQLEADMGVEKYVQECRKWVENTSNDWRWYIDKIGRWVDMENAYYTMNVGYMESVIWAFKQMYEKGFVYKGKRTSLYSTDTSTPVSGFEVAMDADNYRDVDDLSIFTKFKLKETDVKKILKKSNGILRQAQDDKFIRDDIEVEAQDDKFIRDDIEVEAQDDKFIRDDIEVEAQDDKFVRDDIEVGVQGDSIHEAQGDTNKEEFKDVYIVAWTTTPWTIPSNFAVCVNPNYDYCLVKFEGEYLIIAKARLEYTFYTKQENIGTENGNLVQILAEFKGTELEGLQYEPVYDYFKNDSSEKDYHVYLYDGVTIEDGTGVLHVAPAFGEEDFELGQKFGLSGIHDIDSEGKMTVGDWVGIYLRDASPMIAEDLQKRGNLLRSEMHKHRLPFYRGDNPLIYMTQDSYFINIQKIKDRMLDLNKNINWTPENIKDGRFGQTISTSPDWSISRNRYWATIIPVWKNEDGEELVIGSIEEMTQYTDQVIKKEVDGKVEYSFDGQPMDLHRDVCDKIVLVKEGKKYTRIPEVLDCWMDSGSVPFAEHHYPFEHKEEFENAFPADFIVEYVGQVRAWFNVLLRVSTMIFDNQSFNNVICTGVMAGNDGRKMSKSYGNYPDPKDVLNKIGGEAVRLYLMGSTLMVGGDMNWSDEILNEQVKNVLIPIWNVYKYLAIYAELHEWTPENTDFNSTNVLDQWLETYMNKVTSDYSTAMENYNIPESVKLIQPAVDNISSWWIRRSRDRFVAGDKEALQTLYVTIVQFIKTFAPQMPFLTEEIYQNLVSGCGLKSSKESIHLELFPVVDFKKVNTKLLEDMALVREICTLGLKVRDDNRLKLRQPLAKAVLVASEKMILTDEKLIGIIKEELNVKEFQLASKESLLEGLVSNTDGEITIALDTVLSPELREEGLLNELVRAIQNLRKTSGFKMGELVNISVKLSGNDLLNVINKHNSEICKSVSASSFSVVTDLTDGKSVKIEDEEVVFSLIK